MQQFAKSADMLQKHLHWMENEGGKEITRVKETEVYQMLGDSYFYNESKDYSTALTYYLKSLAADSEQKRVLQNVAIAYHTMKSYEQALTYYDKRIALGVDSTTVGILKNAGFCALNLASGNEGFEDGDDLLDNTDGPDMQPPSATESSKDYYQVAAHYLEKYLEQHAD